MVRKIFLIVSVFLLAYLGYAFFAEYFVYHQYYENMLSNWTNTKIVLNALIFGMIPALYVLFAKRRNFWVLIGLIFLSLFGYGVFYIGAKADLLGGVMKYFFNTAFLFGLAVYFLVSLLTIGDWVKQQRMRLQTKSIFGVMLSFGVGLAAFLVINYILIMLNLYYPAVSWLLFVGAGAAIFLQRNNLARLWGIVDYSIGTIAVPRYHQVWNCIIALPLLGYGILGLVAGESLFWMYLCLIVGGGLVASYLYQGFTHNRRGVRILSGRKFWVGIVTLLLLMLSFAYLDMGYMLAYIPYSTAWDANHAYMFYPRMRALNHGYYWNEIAMASGSQLWQVYIAYRFSLFGEAGGFMGISADTIAIEMNFWSSILVLLFGLGLISEVLAYLRDYHGKRNEVLNKVIFLLGWFLLLQWLYSGMGAFLVFIDNKTDMGVLALIILALYSGFVFLRYALKADREEKDDRQTIQLKYTLIGLSGFFYALAVLAKPTAAFDLVNFGLFTWWIYLGSLGTLGLLLLVIGGLSLMGMRGINDYISSGLGKWLTIAGGVGLGGNLLQVYFLKLWKGLKYLLIWAGVFVGVMLIIKGPRAIASNIIYDEGRSTGEMIQRIFLSQHTDDTKNTEELPTHQQIPLYAQTSEASSVASCTLASQGFSSTDELYTDLKDSEQQNEDLGRYVGYGWKGGTTDQQRGIQPFIDPIRGFFLGEGCYSFNPFNPLSSDPKTLCETEQMWKSWDPEQLQEVQGQLNSSRWQAHMQTLIDAAPPTNPNIQELNANYSLDLYELEDYMQDNSIRVVINQEGQKLVYFPYKFLNVFNISFNRSLQNLSSYYTDIGVVWLMLIFFIVVGLIYGLLKRHKLLIAISVVTLFGWLLRHLVASGILWYAIGLVIWTILAFLMYVYYLLNEEDVDGTYLGYIFVIGVFLFGGIQMSLNLQRIASQGGGGAFVWYKTNYGLTEEFNSQLQRQTTPTNRFTKEDVFDMQFPHYREFIELANSREEDEGALIAGTYVRYFIDNQKHIKYDQFLTWLWRMFSDGNTCNSYLRLADNNIKYLVIDPNIGTVVQGAGNQALFDRFFAKVNTNTNEIIEDGVFTMLAKLFEDDYVRYISSNNLGAKYAFTLPDSTFSGLTGEDLVLFRARMATMRFFGGRQSPMFNAAVEIAMQRVQDGSFVTDLADMMGLQIRDNRLILLAQQSELSAGKIEEQNLTTDEKKALTNYLALRQQATDENALRNQLSQLMNNSINAGNQLIVLELVE